MYWPTTPANGEYVFKRKAGDVLDPDEYFSQHPDWRDCSTLPTSSKESAVKPTAAKKLKDPLTKDGVVGAFCNAFTVEEAIHRFLPDVYRPSAVAGRYDYILADSTAGVVIYDDGRFSYSNHAADPAYQMELNA